MAADLIMHAVSAFPGAETVISVTSHRQYLVDLEETVLVDQESEQAQYLREHWTEDWPYRLEETEDGLAIVEIIEGHCDGVLDLGDWFYDRDDYDRIDIGPFSTMKAGLDNDNRWLPGPIVSLSRYLELGKPVIVTPAKAAEIMVALNVADNSYYKKWKNRHGSYRYRRVHRRQWVKKFLAQHQGDLVWLTTE